MADFIITKATVEDAEGILHVQQTAWICTYPNAEHGITKEDVLDRVKMFEAERWRKNISETGEKSEIFVAKANDNVIGFSGAMHEEDRDRISAVYVHPDNHKKGVGRALMQSCLDWLDSSKKPILIEVVAYNEGAIKFYEKFGFKKYRDVPLSEMPKRFFFSSGRAMPEIEMIKAL